ncbi:MULTISPECIES: glycerol-3-phosphate responsive antiterminator [unclassified Paenibacillus]|uniref:glycerol-3-phosphate responsive antiterminator n=1 Tax=unclassified Paenibacillus TaxID=185978 RepID=UPI0009568AAC|nr:MULTISPECIES: glycerol-3-phosphate responsive antiterminator [unclassified Paenibacillus]ASS68653.1 glycerol-3-phosphate responsive antiterminator [Paenibacillus sp. RUD330]SIR55002.1 glycerol uptake operon antiterminator [Paenibacillus sp. RU4X]SIR63512.1 glycerol uptake operon antiterminator [Paenibacillus sp. RU4T]
MNAEQFRSLLEERRIIASLKQPKHIEHALELRSRLSGVFLLMGHIGVLGSYVDVFRSHGIPVFLHLEKIGGLSTDSHGIDYLAKTIRPAGIVSTKTSVIRAAKKRGLLTVQRFFLVDSEGLSNISGSLEQTMPDVVELMPARIPEMIARVRRFADVPIITGGLLSEPCQGRLCLDYGAAAISSSDPRLWRADYSGHSGSGLERSS